MERETLDNFQGEGYPAESGNGLEKRAHPTPGLALRFTPIAVRVRIWPFAKKRLPTREDEETNHDLSCGSDLSVSSCLH